MGEESVRTDIFRVEESFSRHGGDFCVYSV